MSEVYSAISAVQKYLSKTGIAKDSKNREQNYCFRGIDAVFNVLAPVLAEHQLCILPRVLSRVREERTTAKGTVLFYVTVEVEFDFVSAKDGSKHTVKTFGEAMDTGDKATNKAMSAAYKYAALQAFSIPTEGDNDADATTHDEITPSKKRTSEKAVESILRSQSLAELKHVFANEYRFAESMNDASMLAEVVSAKEKRKTELEQGA